MPRYSIHTLQEHGAALISEYQAADRKRTDTLKDLAAIIVSIRGKVKDPKLNDQPDWAGRTQQAKQAVQEMYEKAGVPSDSQANIQNNVRYHVSALLHEKAPKAELSKAGLKNGSAKERAHARQSATQGASSIQQALSRAVDALRQADAMTCSDDERPQATMLVLQCEALLNEVRTKVLTVPTIQGRRTRKATAPTAKAAPRGSVRNPKQPAKQAA